jgi:hypothetical protein
MEISAHNKVVNYSTRQTILRYLSTVCLLADVFGQYCRFLVQSGYTEKAVASCQALVEFNLFRPPLLNLTPTPQSATLFESFWNSGVARFGEVGAKGWAAWMNKTGAGSGSSGTGKPSSFGNLC